MTIGEQIIAAINENRLVHDATDYRYAVPLYKNKWHENAQYLLDAVVDAHVAERVKAKIEEIAESIGWRREGSLWRDPVDGKRWAWTTDDLMREMTARLLVKPDAGGS